MMGGEVASFLLGTSVLWLLVGVSIILAWNRTPLPRRGGLPKLIIATGCLALFGQMAHVGEELNAGFYTNLPTALGLDPWPRSGFLAINLAFIALWVVSISLRGGTRRAADIPLWLLAIASCANAVVHPTLALWTGGYFPGLLTSPLVGLTGAGLLFALFRNTRWANHD